MIVSSPAVPEPHVPKTGDNGETGIIDGTTGGMKSGGVVPTKNAGGMFSKISGMVKKIGMI